MADDSVIQPDEGDREFAGRLHREFAPRPRSRFIPSVRSLTWLAATLRARRPRRVLEFGGGIGTITAALLRHPCGIERLVSTEDDSRFEAILRAEDDPRLTVVTSAHELAAMDYVADLIVVDGGFGLQLGDPIEAASAREGSLIFVDGKRERQRRALEHNLAGRGLSVDLREHGLPRFHTYLYVNWRRPSIRLLPVPKGCWLGRVSRAGKPK